MPRAPRTPPSAFERATRLLTVRSRSEAELRRRLTQAGHAADEIEACIERLRVAGFVDDEQYARQVARSRLTSGGRYARRVRQELQSRGVARDVIAEAVAEVVADEGVDERASALALARRRAVALRGLDPQVARRRLYGFLARKGFAPDAIGAAVRQALGAAALDDE